MKKSFFILFLTLIFIFSSCEENPPTEVSPYVNLKAGPNSPYYHQIYTLESEDGTTWTQINSEPLYEHASVPAIAYFEETLMIYFVDASTPPEGLGCLYSKDDGVTFIEGECTLEGTPTDRNVDFSFISVSDESRLYYYSIDSSLGAEDSHSIRYATTEDGFHFTDQGEVFNYPGLVDPDVFYNGSVWIMHVFSLTDGETIVALSEDGIQFTYEGSLPFQNFGFTKPIEIDGGFRMYAFKQGEQDAFYSFFSEDGLTWTQEEGIRWEATEDLEITDPSVIQLPDGSYKMIFKGNKRTENPLLTPPPKP